MDDARANAGAAGDVSLPDLVGGAQLYLSGEDALLLTVFNAAAGVRVRLTGRFLQLGTARPNVFSFDIVPATDRSASTIVAPLGEGWLLEASVVVSSGTPLIGQTFTTLVLQRGLGTAALVLSTLAQGYITARQRAGWPGGTQRGSLEGAGALRSITGATPGAGAEISETVPTGARWELLSLATQFISSAVVATRNSILTFDDGAAVFGRFAISNNQAAGATLQLTWGPGRAFISGEPQQGMSAAIPVGLGLAAGHRIRTSTVSIQAADQYSAVQYLVREWIEGA